MKKVLLGAALTILTASLVALVVLRLGLVPVSADGTHSTLEARIMPVVLHAAVVRQAAGENMPTPITDADLQSAKHTFNVLCATCHGTLNGKPSEYGQSFYPPAPTLKGSPSKYKDAEIFWIIKHGIRNTGMPAWSGTLSDREIWQLAAVLKESSNDK